METQTLDGSAASTLAPEILTTRSWDQVTLPAPLISYEQAEIVALGILRSQPEYQGVVGAGIALIRQTLEDAGVSSILLLLTGPSLLQPNLLLETDHQSIERFDELHSLVLSGPQQPDTAVARWLRLRRLSHLQHLALGSSEMPFYLPDVDRLWTPSLTPAQPYPSVPKWLLQATPLLVGGIGATVAYIYNAGPAPELWPLLVVPMVGSLAFGGWLFRRLAAFRQQVAAAWLARPARLRPDTIPVAKALARKPWALLYLPVLLLLVSFTAIVLMLAASTTPTLTLMLWPLSIGLLAQLVWSYLYCRRQLAHTRSLVQGLPTALLPADLHQCWQSYLYY